MVGNSSTTLFLRWVASEASGGRGIKTRERLGMEGWSRKK